MYSGGATGVAIAPPPHDYNLFSLSAHQRSVMVMIVPLPHYDFFFLGGKNVSDSPPPPPQRFFFKGLAQNFTDSSS